MLNQYLKHVYKPIVNRGTTVAINLNNKALQALKQLVELGTKSSDKNFVTVMKRICTATSRADAGVVKCCWGDFEILMISLENKMRKTTEESGEKRLAQQDLLDALYETEFFQLYKNT